MTFLTGIYFRVALLYALDTRTRLQHLYPDQGQTVYDYIGLAILCSLLVLPTTITDRCFRYGSCFMIMNMDYHFLKHYITNNNSSSDKELMLIMKCPLKVVWMKSDWVYSNNSICNVQSNNSLNVSTYDMMIIVLACLYVGILIFRFAAEHRYKMIFWLTVTITLHVLILYLFPVKYIASSDVNLKVVVLLALQAILAWAYLNTFNIHGYMRCVLISAFLYTETARLSYFIFLCWTVWYFVQCLARLDEITNFQGLESFNIKRFSQSHYREILLSIFFYSMFNIMFTGLITYDPNSLFIQHAQLTVSSFCKSWIGIGCFIIFVFFISRAVTAAAIFYLRGFKRIKIRIENPCLSDIWIMVFLLVQSSEMDTHNQDQYLIAGVLMIVSNLLNDVHNLAEPVLMELISSKGIIRKQWMIYVFFGVLGLVPIFLLFNLDEEMNVLSVWWRGVYFTSLTLTTVEVITSVSMHCILRFSLFKSNFKKSTNMVLGLSLYFHIFYGILFLLWCISSITLSISGLILLVLSPGYLYSQWQQAWEMLKQRQSKISRLAWKPCKWDSRLVENGDKCSVCLCSLELNSLGNFKMSFCNHIFHESCIRKWCILMNDCPLCV